MVEQTRGFRLLIKRLRILLWEGESLWWKLRVFLLNSGQVIPSIALLQNGEINNCNDMSDVEEVPETCFNVPEGQKGNPSEYPFGIYPLLNKDRNIREHKINEEESSLK
nr:nucleotide-binding alpha-beta plait domain-containing protein [Tanacetum cinerariifolium]